MSGLFPAGDIDGHAIEADGLAGLVVEASADGADPAEASVRRDGAVLDIVFGLRGDAVGDGGSGTFAVVGMEPLVEGVDGDIGVGGKSKVFFGGVVPVQLVEG